MPHRAAMPLRPGYIAVRRRRIAQAKDSLKYKRLMKKIHKEDRKRTEVLSENVVFRNLRTKAQTALDPVVHPDALGSHASKLTGCREDSPPPGGVLSIVKELGPPPQHTLPSLSTALGGYAGTSWAPIVVEENTTTPRNR